CCAAKGPALRPRSLGQTWYGGEPNEVVHFDFLFTRKSKKTAFCCVSTIRDGFTGYCELVPCVDQTAATAAAALLAWMGRFGNPITWVGDRGPHFYNELLAEIGRRRGVEHHFTTARCLWANRQVERANK